MTFTPWSLLSDAGLLAALLVTGTVLRARVRLVQRLMLPASVIAGFLGLALGPEGLGLLPFSDQLGTYASVLIVVVFACLALTDGLSFKGMGRSAGAYGSYSVAAYALQVGLGMIFALVVLGLFWDVPDGFGTLLFAGWAGASAPRPRSAPPSRPRAGRAPPRSGSPRRRPACWRASSAGSSSTTGAPGRATPRAWAASRRFPRSCGPAW